jgi:HAD superfamily hydrolase (TIGR01549 family)
LPPYSVAVFDLDGTLLDSDEALAAPFVALGIPREQVTFGHVVADECRRLGIAIDDYLSRYDVGAAPAYPGADELIAGLGRWAVCSNKVRWAGEAELARLGWTPEVALFADDFGGASKAVAPVLERLAVDPAAVVFVGDTAHDRTAARDAGVAFALAGWNPRAEPQPGDLVLRRPTDLLAHLA